MMRIIPATRTTITWMLVAAFSLQVAGCGGSERVKPHVASDWAVPSDDAIEALLADRMRHNGVGMVVGVVDGQRRVVVAHGVSGAADGRPLDGETVFQLGSLTKVITGLLLADMTARGEVDLDEPVNELLPPEGTMIEVARPITLRDLSTHTSGLPSMPGNFDIHGEPDPYAAYTVDQLWSFLSSYTPDRAPGKAYEYSNLGVSLLGWALALRLGTTYEALVKERILAPLGMDSTSITLTSDQLERLAPGHDPYLHPIRTWEMATLQASGSLRSTADDMLRLLEAYLGRTNVPHVSQAMELQLREGVEVDGKLVPLGLGLRPDGTYSHAGGKQGYRSGLAFDPKTGVGAVVLANTRTYDSEPMAIALHLVTGRPLPPASRAPEDKPRMQASSGELKRFAGRYRSDAGEWEVAVAGALLRIRYPDKSILEFVPSGPGEFFYNAGNDDITFDIGAEGQVVGMTVYGDGKPEGGGRYAARIEE
ncbi:serine hydrolase domain-containing protein [Luteimonas suaedae]|uniref:serine hydrolase domain-containing protein n=1 Tax=Luteimonas suaedae TaxID=2605430 RepID=UPI0016596A3C|nr:serine hydrolase domain-containing protein [Luteimonas suaedae]